MNLRDAQPAEMGWRARLELGYAYAGEERTVLKHRRHSGPWLVQKPFYPEGSAVCHSTLVHPPGGIAGGDQLELNLDVEAGAHAVITTPGAAKWYRSSGEIAKQRCEVNVGRDATLEWLPQPSIVFDGARAEQSHQVRLAANARYIGWDILCLGRIARGERYEHGMFRSHTEVAGAHRRLWIDRAAIAGGGVLLSSPAGLGGHPVTGLFLAAGIEISRDLIDRCREITAGAPERCGVTSLPCVLAARFLGDSLESAWQYFVALWNIVRPALIGRAACAPRIWQT
jgi:urease accessory protein